MLVILISDLGECSPLDHNNNNEVAMTSPPATPATPGVIFEAAAPTASEWVFIGVILALSVGMAVLWIEYKRLKNKTLRNLLSQGCCTLFF